MNFSRKMKAGVAALAAIATLGAGGVVASTAFAGGGGGNQPGTGGDLAAVQFWQYKDDASGAWGPATSLDSVRAAMNNAGVTLEGNGITKAQAALDQARTECETGFQRRHPGEGNGDCRVVAVGAVPAVIGGNYIYNGSGVASPTGTGGWYDNWNTYVAPNTYKYAGTQNYHTSDGFSDDPSNSVDAIMRRNVGASSKPSIVVIVLDKYQPAPPTYHLSVSTQAAEMSGQAGDTKDASDVITLSSDGSKTENVNGTATLHWRGIDGTEKTVAKQFTASNKGSATVSASFKDMDASWESWPAGKRWWDVDVAKQGDMAEAVSHKGENDGKESGEKTTTPPEKWLTNGAGDTVRDGNDSIASGSLYTAHIKAHSNASGKFWIYDTIDTRDVVIGGTEQDDVSKVTVTDANGNIVPADISIDDSIDGKRVVKAHATAPHSGLYTLNVPQSAKPTGGDYEINDGSVACWNGDNGTGSLADCQTGNGDGVGKVTPTPDKVWVLDESGALVAEDKGWTNQQGVDQKTFLVGDQVGVVVNGSIPAHLLNPLASYSITDDLTGSNQWIDWKSGKVFVDGKDETANFTIAIDRKAGTATATAKSAYIAKTMFRNSASKVRFYLTGTIKKGATEGKKIQLTNKAYEKWNNETRPTNEPPVFVWTPNPNKAWAMAQIMDQYAAGGASNDVTLTLTFRYTDRDGKYLEAGEAARRISLLLPSIREQIAQAGGGAARALGMEEITRMVRVAYDPAAQETIEESDEPPYIAWEDCGPLMHEAGWSHYSHDSGLSRTWEMVDPPQSNVTADTLTRLLSPLADCDRKRVTVLYRMLPPDKTMFMAEQNRQKAANQVSQEKRATVRSMSQIGKANRQAVETNQGAVMVFFGMLVTVTVSRGEQESQRLEAASRAVEQAAGGAKIDLRPCYGAQDTGFAASLPLGLNVRSYTPAGPLGRLLS